MNTKVISLLVAGALAPACIASAAETTFAKWDFTLPQWDDHDLTTITATGSTGTGQKWGPHAGSTSTDNFAGSKVFNSSEGYSLRKSVAARKNVRASTGMTAADWKGKVYVTFDFSSWNMPDNGIDFNVDATTSTGANIMAMRLQSRQVGGEWKVGLDYFSYGGGEWGGWSTARQPDAVVLFDSSMENVMISMELNVVTNMGTLYYKIGDNDWVKTGLTTKLGGTGDRPLEALLWGQYGILGEINDEMYDFNVRSITVSNAIPEPSTYGLIGSALVMGIVLVNRRRRSIAK